ncbi:MAG: hypothetical protein ABEH77_11225 [Halobacteriaceae archaeon]
MAGFPFPNSGPDGLFDGYDEFVPEHVPEPGEFLDGHAVLTGDDHVEFHRVTRDVFEERTVYDMTFNYNLARLNLDTRHEDAGYRYAEQADDPSVLRAEFTPTTPFCPQTQTLTIGAFRAWNGSSGQHDYDLVRVRTATAHHRSATINERLAALETEYEETGTIPGGSSGRSGVGSPP